MIIDRSNEYKSLINEIYEANQIMYRGVNLMIPKKEMSDIEYLKSISTGPYYNEKEDRHFAWRWYTLANMPKVFSNCQDDHPLSLITLSTQDKVLIKILKRFDNFFPEILTSIYFYDFELNTFDDKRELNICLIGDNMHFHFKLLIYSSHNEIVINFLKKRNIKIEEKKFGTLDYLLEYTHEYEDIGFKDIGDFLCDLDIAVGQSKNKIAYSLETFDTTFTSFSFIITFNKNSIE